MGLTQVTGGWRQPVTVKSIELHEPAHLGNAKVASVESVKLTRSLWHAMRGRNVDVLLCKLWADCSLTPDGQLRLTRALQVLLGAAVRLR